MREPGRRVCQVQELGRLSYAAALELQRRLVEQRRQGLIPDQFLLLEHPHVITLGRNGRPEHLLAPLEILRRAGIEFYHTERGGDITYHGPGQLIGYPILNLREWRQDVVAYVRALEQVIIEALGKFGLRAERVAGRTGVWVDGRKIAAIGVRISRWITSHGFALNVSTDLSYFGYIVPCGLSAPVTSMAELGVRATLGEVMAALVPSFGDVFECEMIMTAVPGEQQT